MHWTRALPTMLLAAGFFAGCGGDDPAPAAEVSTSLLQQRLGVEYDQNADGELDVLTLDTTTTPYRIVEMLQGMPAGAPMDVTPVMYGAEIDPGISAALANHLGNSINVRTRTEMNVRNQLGESATIVVYE